MLPPGARIGVAVSGGADSVCLLHVLRRLSSAPLTVLHVDHQLRGEESRADAEFVAAMANEFGLPLISRRVELRDGNLEQEGRRARLDFFREVIRSRGADRVATGHTQSDQAETVLFRLLRGSGEAGLAGIRPVTSDGLVRPLIEIARPEIERFLRNRGIAWREDSTNASPRFARNRIRHDLLPILERDWNPAIAAAMARTAEWALDDVEYWNQEIDRLEPGILLCRGQSVVVDVEALRGVPTAVARRLVRRAVERVKGDLRGVDFAYTELVLQLARSDRGRGSVSGAGVEARRSFDWIRFAPTQKASGEYRMSVSVPGHLRIPGADVDICVELIDKSDGFNDLDYVYNEGMGWVDWECVSGCLELRSWMPGDRYQPADSTVVKKLKDLFQLARIPVWERRHWPVLVDGSSIVWTRRFGPAAEYAAGPRTRRVLRLREMTAT